MELEDKILTVTNLKFKNPSDYALFTNIILSTHGEDHITFKRAVDTQSIKFSLIDIISRLETHDAERVWSHIRTEGESLRKQRSRVKIISDIDDTFQCSLHDTSYPHGSVYPGCIAFYECLDSNPEWDSLLTRPTTRGDLVFLTARPTGPQSVLRWITKRLLGKKGVNKDKTTILTGSVLKMFTSSGMAEKKLDNFKKYHKIFPEFDFVFIGDSGQGDIALCRLLKEYEQENSFHVLCLIKDIVYRSGKRKISSKTREKLKEEEIFVFDSYMKAAQITFKNGLITKQQLLFVANASFCDFKAIRFSFSGKNTKKKTSRLKELVYDFESMSL